MLRIAREIEGYVVELGSDGRLVSLQLDELVAGVAHDRMMILRDYVPSSSRRPKSVAKATDALDALSSNDLLDLVAVATAIGFAAGAEGLEASVSPRGFRLLSRVPRLPEVVIDRLVSRFGTLQKLLAAGMEDLLAVEGVGETRARTVREGLSRLAESSILDRYM